MVKWTTIRIKESREKIIKFRNDDSGYGYKFKLIFIQGDVPDYFRERAIKVENAGWLEDKDGKILGGKEKKSRRK